MESIRRRRLAARMILLDEIGRILLFRGVDPMNSSGPTWWFTPGGGREGNETDEQTARREVFEETGHQVEVMSGPVLHREFDVVFAGELIHQVEVYFVAHVTAFEPHSVGWTELERRTILDHRWWSPADLESSTELVYPTNLAEVIRSLGRPELP